MPKTKNDPAHYRTRASLVPRRTPVRPAPDRSQRPREEEFLTAPIDERFYIDFRPVKPGSRR